MRASGRRDKDINVVGRSHGPADEQEDIMRTLGYIAAITIAAAGAALGLLVVKSVPDMRRYVAIRQM